MELELSKTTIHYESFGEGYPLLALHGFYTDHRQMIRMLEPAFEDRDGWRRIYIDVPGHGKSNGTETIKDDDDMLDTILEFIDTEIQGQGFAVAGTSYGSILAQGVVTQRSKDVIGLLLVAPDVDHGSEDTKLPPRTQLVKHEIPEENIRSLEPFQFLYETELVVQSPEAFQILREVIVPAFKEADGEFLGKMDYLLSIKEDMLTRHFDCPALFIMGRQDHQTGYQNVWKIIENFPRASFVVLDRAGHIVATIEQLSLCQALIKEWLDRVEESQTTKA